MWFYYTTLCFLSNLSYGIEIWGNIYNSNLNILNLSQKKNNKNNEKD